MCVYSTFLLCLSYRVHECKLFLLFQIFMALFHGQFVNKKEATILQTKEIYINLEFKPQSLPSVFGVNSQFSCVCLLCKSAWLATSRPFCMTNWSTKENCSQNITWFNLNFPLYLKLNFAYLLLQCNINFYSAISHFSLVTFRNIWLHFSQGLCCRKREHFMRQKHVFACEIIPKCSPFFLLEQTKNLNIFFFTPWPAKEAREKYRSSFRCRLRFLL